MSLYELKTSEEDEKGNTREAVSSLYGFIKEDKFRVFASFFFVITNSIASILAPYIIGRAVDQYIVNKDTTNLVQSVALLALVYVYASFSSYMQIRTMGVVGQHVLFKLRNVIFGRLQSLPLAFFNSNKSGDLISRINNDTEKLNQVLSEIFIRILGSIFILIGIGIFVLSLNFTLGAVMLSFSILLFGISKLMSGWIQRKNRRNLETTGSLSGELKESLQNFKIIVAFNRRDYFRNSFEKVNADNYKAAKWAGYANTILSPIFNFGSSIAQMAVVFVGIHLITQGQITIGLLVTFITYANDFYQPLRELAGLFATLQKSVAAWSRISEILRLHTNLIQLDEVNELPQKESNQLISFKNVSFNYSEEVKVLKDIHFEIKKGKTYALVGPTGGGKSTTAALIARLYDPTEGTIYLHGKDLRSYSNKEISSEIGFILQEPILFTGTVGENIMYGNDELTGLSHEEINKMLTDLNLSKVIEKFNEGLDTKIGSNGEGISLGQKQLVAFLRILLRKPSLLILDEATANIDTVTEELLQSILDKLPKETSKVIIAHRLNTIKNADEVFFIANGEMKEAMSYEEVVELIEQTKRGS